MTVAKVSRTPSSLAFLVVGDWGRDGDFHQCDVADQMGKRAATANSRFTVTVGDNFYPAGVQTATDRQWQTSFEDIYTAPSLQSPWFATLGNHDYRGRPDAQIAYAATSPRWRMPARYYQQRMATPGGMGVDLFMLDTSPMVTRYGTGSENLQIKENVRHEDPAAQLRWLDKALVASNAPWKLVFGHHPVFSGGSSHGSTPKLIAGVKPLLERHGVQAYVSGHDHDLQHIELDGIAYICTGAGSQTRSVEMIAGSRFCSDRSGFTAYHVDESGMAVQFIDFTGTVMHTANVSLHNTVRKDS